LATGGHRVIDDTKTAVAAPKLFGRSSVAMASRRSDQKDYAQRLRQFFDHYLKGAPAPEWLEKASPSSTATRRRNGLTNSRSWQAGLRSSYSCHAAATAGR